MILGFKDQRPTIRRSRKIMKLYYIVLLYFYGTIQYKEIKEATKFQNNIHATKAVFVGKKKYSLKKHLQHIK